jgi:hypothetical protein
MVDPLEVYYRNFLERQSIFDAELSNVESIYLDIRRVLKCKFVRSMTV